MAFIATSNGDQEEDDDDGRSISSAFHIIELVIYQNIAAGNNYAMMFQPGYYQVGRTNRSIILQLNGFRCEFHGLREDDVANFQVIWMKVLVNKWLLLTNDENRWIENKKNRYLLPPHENKALTETFRSSQN